MQEIDKSLIQETVREVVRQSVIQTLVRDRMVSRKIVAMLFWEWKYRDRCVKQYNNHEIIRYEIAQEAYSCFKQAYEMLKVKICKNCEYYTQIEDCVEKSKYFGCCNNINEDKYLLKTEEFFSCEMYEPRG